MSRYTLGDFRSATSGLPDSTPLFVSGLEGVGYDDASAPETVVVKINKYRDDGVCGGDHEAVWTPHISDTEAESQHEVVEGLALS